MAVKVLNKVMMMGNLVKDPELRYTPSGTPVCSLRIAINRQWKSQDGEQKEESYFFNIVAWNKLAEICHKILAKGMLVYIEGELRTRQWETQEGERRMTTEIYATDMILLDSKGRRGVGADSEGSSNEAQTSRVKGLNDAKKGGQESNNKADGKSDKNTKDGGTEKNNTDDPLDDDIVF